MSLGGEMVDLVWAGAVDQRGGISRDVEGVKSDVVADRDDAPVVGDGGGADRPVDDVASGKKEFSQVRPVLPANPGNEGDLSQAMLSFVHAAMNPVEDTDGQLLSLFALALSIRGKVFVELGVRHPRSTLPLLWAAHLSGGMLWSVDNQEFAHAVPAQLRDSWRPVQANVLHFLSAWSRETKIDLVFIDDWHAYPHVRFELELLDPLIGPGSLILLHDAMHGHTEPFYNVDLSITEGQWEGGGPARAMMELDRLRWEWATLPWWHGLSIIRKKHSKLFWPR